MASVHPISRSHWSDLKAPDLKAFEAMASETLAGLAGRSSAALRPLADPALPNMRPTMCWMRCRSRIRTTFWACSKGWA